MQENDAELDKQIENEYRYLRRLREESRTADLAARVATLRDYGWEILSIAAAMEVSRQWLYQALASHPEVRNPQDAPPIVDLRPEPDPRLTMRSDLADVPPPLCKPLQAMWAHVFRDKSGGTSPVSTLLDTTIYLLLRRGVPYVRIADCGGVTHRAASERLRRALTRETLPKGLSTTFLSWPTTKLLPPRTAAQANHPGRLFTVVQVVATSFPRFYTLRHRTDPKIDLKSGRASDPMFFFNPERPATGLLEEAGLTEFMTVTEESDWTEAIAQAAPDSSPLYMVPVQWLYVTSHADQVFQAQFFDPIVDFYPESFRPTGDMLRFFTDTDQTLRETEPIEWGGPKS